MKPKKLNILFTFFAYSGTSTGTSEVSDIREWFSQLLLRLKTDPKFTERIDEISMETIADTPITMNRNYAVKKAKEIGADILVMVDSDMRPDVHLNDGADPTAVPFFDVAFDAIYDHYEKGPLVIAAPYGGAPPHENMFVFHWRAMGNLGEESRIELSQYTREEAASMAGLHEAGALPTGLIAYDIRAFDLIEHPYFHYEWTDETQSEKASTEDVQNTRDIALAGLHQLGYNPLLCAWSSWAGHLKTWCVKKPWKYTAESVAENLAKALSRGSSRERTVDLSQRNQKLLEEIGRQINNEKVVYSADAWKRENMTAPQPEKDENGLWVYGHKTPKEHLDFLRDLVLQQSEKAGRNIDVIEIGSWLGESAITMTNTGKCRVLCVDTWKGSESDWTGQLANLSGNDLRGMFLENIGTIKDPMYPVSWWGKESVDAAKNVVEMFGDFTPADIVFIDADHSYPSTKADILAWLPHISINGVMIGHDYKTVNFPGVEEAVHEVFEGYPIYQMSWSKEHGGFWMVKMTDVDREEIFNRFNLLERAADYGV